MNILGWSRGRLRARLVLLVTALGLVMGLHAISPPRAHAEIAICELGDPCDSNGDVGGGGGVAGVGGYDGGGDVGNDSGDTGAGDTDSGGETGSDDGTGSDTSGKIDPTNPYVDCDGASDCVGDAEGSGDPPVKIDPTNPYVDCDGASDCVGDAEGSGDPPVKIDPTNPYVDAISGVDAFGPRPGASEACAGAVVNVLDAVDQQGPNDPATWGAWLAFRACDAKTGGPPLACEDEVERVTNIILAGAPEAAKKAALHIYALCDAMVGGTSTTPLIAPRPAAHGPTREATVLPARQAAQAHVQLRAANRAARAGMQAAMRAAVPGRTLKSSGRRGSRRQHAKKHRG